MQIIQGEIIEIIANKNMILTNGETFAYHLWLGINDSPSNWHEVPIEEVPQDEQFTENNLYFPN